MTCIAGWIEESTVFMGCDSIGSNGSHETERKDRKMFKAGEFLIGCTSSYRMLQLLQYSETGDGIAGLHPPSSGKDLHRFMVNQFTERVREILKAGGYSKISDNQETGGFFLVATQGRLFQIESDFQVGESANDYDAVGCGYLAALGAFHALEPYEIPAKDRVREAIKAAAHCCAGVGGTIHIASI